ncbi:MAG: hypothetical protein V7607_1212 [Solirubrobacteraceae bacterium]
MNDESALARALPQNSNDNLTRHLTTSPRDVIAGMTADEREQRIAELEAELGMSDEAARENHARRQARLLDAARYRLSRASRKTTAAPKAPMPDEQPPEVDLPPDAELVELVVSIVASARGVLDAKGMTVLRGMVYMILIHGGRAWIGAGWLGACESVKLSRWTTKRRVDEIISLGLLRVVQKEDGRAPWYALGKPLQSNIVADLLATWAEDGPERMTAKELCALVNMTPDALARMLTQNDIASRKGWRNGRQARFYSRSDIAETARVFYDIFSSDPHSIAENQGPGHDLHAVTKEGAVEGTGTTALHGGADRVPASRKRDEDLRLAFAIVDLLRTPAGHTTLSAVRREVREALAFSRRPDAGLADQLERDRERWEKWKGEQRERDEHEEAMHEDGLASARQDTSANPGHCEDVTTENLTTEREEIEA